jgi:hypothetical protein
MSNIHDVAKEPSCFLVYDKNFIKNRFQGSFFAWLENEGFEYVLFADYAPCGNWVFINIITKTYAIGKQGICLTAPVGSHAITVDEFKIIYNIYKKYAGLDPLIFSQKEEEAFREQMKEYDRLAKQDHSVEDEKEYYRLKEKFKKNKEALLAIEKRHAEGEGDSWEWLESVLDEWY